MGCDWLRSYWFLNGDWWASRRDSVSLPLNFEQTGNSQEEEEEEEREEGRGSIDRVMEEEREEEEEG